MGKGKHSGENDDSKQGKGSGDKETPKSGRGSVNKDNIKDVVDGKGKWRKP